MGFVPGNYEKLQVEETESRSAIGEKVLYKIAATVNKGIDDVSGVALGTIEISMLTEFIFLQYRGDRWLLCNGQSCAGTQYATLTGNTTVPDMRGRFLRGKNNGSGIDPVGELALGTNKEDRLKAHEHVIEVTGIPDSPLWHPGRFFTDGSDQINMTFVEPVNNLLELQSFNNVGIESRPENITVNFFIKVN